MPLRTTASRIVRLALDHASALALAAAFVSACGGGGEPTPPVGGAVHSVAIVASGTSLRVGETMQLEASARSATGIAVPAAGAPSWRTSNDRVATVDASGRLSAVAPGTATITATIAGVAGTLGFTVAAGAVSQADVFTPGNTFSPFSVTLLAGGTVYFRITGVPHNVIFTPGQTGAPANVNIVENVTAARIFPVRGTFPYDCTVHPGMSGQVVVQ